MNLFRTAVHTMLVAGLLGVSCAQPPRGVAADQTIETQDNAANFQVETVASGLEVPWGFAFLPNKDMLFTERPGRVRIIENGKLRAEPVYVVPDVEPSSESGLMDISLHPNFAANNYVYLAYAYNKAGKRDKVVRYTYTGGNFTEPKVIIEHIPAAPNHAGMRCRFGPDGKLYITTGDSTERALAQQMNSLGGKILRLNDDGSVPQDNPFVGQKDVRPEIWTLGHRNPQGIAWQPGSGLIFETEHGPSGFDGPGGGDEVNIVERGKNYGWPTIHHKQTQAGWNRHCSNTRPHVPRECDVLRRSRVSAIQGQFLFRVSCRQADHSCRARRPQGRQPGKHPGREIRPDPRDGRGTRRLYLFFDIEPRRTRFACNRRRPNHAHRAGKMINAERG